MSKLKTESDAIYEINNKVQELNSVEGFNIKFIGFKENKWLGPDKSIVIIYCLKHKEAKEFDYRGFVRKGRLNIRACDKCYLEQQKRKIQELEESYTEDINKRVNEINSHGHNNISFLGFLDNDPTNMREVRLIIRCNVHNRIQNPTLKGFLNRKRDTFCMICTNHNTQVVKNKTMFDRLVEKYKDFPQYDFSSILSEEELGSDSKRKITVFCKIHNETFTKSYGQLMHSKDCIICKKCRKETYFENIQNLKKEMILNAIEERKEQNINISFLGFVGGKYTSTSTKLILRCNNCGSIWETTEFEKFILGETINGCPTCSHKISYSTEQKCYNIVTDKLGIKAKRNHFIWIKDKNRKQGKRRCFIDIYIPKYNIFIEYNGRQHYEHIIYFHGTLEEYYDQLVRDKLLIEYCAENKIKLLSIPYVDKNNLEDIIKTFIETGKDITSYLIPEAYD